MKNLAVILIIVLVISASCEKDNNHPAPIVDPDYHLSINESFEIELGANPSTGYTWNCANLAKVNFIDSVNWNYVPDLPIRDGGGGKEIWVFKAISKGVDSIRFEYNRSWESNSTIEIKTFWVKVD